MIPDPRIFKLHDSFNEKIFKFIDWGKYYFCFSPGVFFASGLVYSYKLLEFSVMLVIITYLTSSSEQINLTKASVIVNAKDLISATSVIVLTFISNTFIGRPKVITCSAVFTSAGLVMLYFIAHAEESDEIERRILFKIIGVFVTAVGEAGVMALLGDFIADQLRAREPKTNKNEDRVEARKTVWWRGAWCFSVITSFLIRDYSWADTFSFSAKATVITLIFFVVGTAWLHYCGKSAPAGSHKYDSHDVNVYQSRRPRLTDQAKVREPSTLRPQGQDMEGRHHSGKIFLNMIPMGSSFLVYGLVVSTAETFFPEQGEEMQLSSFFTILFVFQSVSSKSISYLFSYFLDSEWVPVDKRKQAKLVRIWFGMVLTIFCCFVAERVEVHRLIVVNKEGFLDKPDQIIPMSIFWLAPQYCLLGLTKGIAEEGLDEFLIDNLPISWKGYVSAITKFVIGIGNLLSIISVHAYRSLFADTLNRSRLDEYYKRITIFSFVNMCYYWCIYIFYTKYHTANVVGDDIVPKLSIFP